MDFVLCATRSRVHVGLPFSVFHTHLKIWLLLVIFMGHMAENITGHG